ncbi:hypothetical protein ACFXTH_015015 [Malus domestica]
MIQRALGANDVMKYILDWFVVMEEESTFGDYVWFSDLWDDIEAITIKWELRLTWGSGVNIPFYLATSATIDVQWSLLTNRSLSFYCKRVMVINDHDKKPVLLSYEKLFEVCFYCGRMRSERHTCPVIDDKDEWHMVDKLFDDEPLVYPAGAEITKETRQELHGGLLTHSDRDRGMLAIT